MEKKKLKNRCPYCNSEHIVCHGTNNTVYQGKRQRYKCQEEGCAHTFYLDNKKSGRLSQKVRRE